MAFFTKHKKWERGSQACRDTGLVAWPDPSGLSVNVCKRGKRPAYSRLRLKMAAEVGLSADGDEDLLEENSTKPIVYSDEVEEAIGQVFFVLVFGAPSLSILDKPAIVPVSLSQ